MSWLVIPHITIGDEQIVKVETCKLLWVELHNRLTWYDHIENVHKKTSTRLYFISQLQRTKMKAEDMVKVYTCLVRQ